MTVLIPHGGEIGRLPGRPGHGDRAVVRNPDVTYTNSEIGSLEADEDKRILRGVRAKVRLKNTTESCKKGFKLCCAPASRANKDKGGAVKKVRVNVRTGRGKRVKERLPEVTIAENNAVHTDHIKRCPRCKRAVARLIGVTYEPNPLLCKEVVLVADVDKTKLVIVLKLVVLKVDVLKIEALKKELLKVEVLIVNVMLNVEIFKTEIKEEIT